MGLRAEYDICIIFCIRTIKQQFCVFPNLLSRYQQSLRPLTLRLKSQQISPLNRFIQLFAEFDVNFNFWISSSV